MSNFVLGCVGVAVLVASLAMLFMAASLVLETLRDWRKK